MARKKTAAQIKYMIKMKKKKATGLERELKKTKLAVKNLEKSMKAAAKPKKKTKKKTVKKKKTMKKKKRKTAARRKKKTYW